MYYFNIDGSIPGDGVAEALLSPVQCTVAGLGGAPGTVRLWKFFLPAAPIVVGQENIMALYLHRAPYLFLSDVSLHHFTLSYILSLPHP